MRLTWSTPEQLSSRVAPPLVTVLPVWLSASLPMCLTPVLVGLPAGSCHGGIGNRSRWFFLDVESECEPTLNKR